MGRRRSIATREKDAKAVDLRRRGLTYDQIGAQLGCAASSAHEAVQRGLREALAEPAAELIQLESERLDALRRLFERITATKHYYAAASTGKVALHPVTQEPLLDDGPALQAGLALLRVSESYRKLKGLDAPARSRVEVITEDVVDAELADLARRVAENDAAAAGTGTA